MNNPCRLSLFCALLLCWVVADAALAVTLPLPPATWGNPDQVWGTRRPVTDKDRETIAEFRSSRHPATYATSFKDAAAFEEDWVRQTDNPGSLLGCRQPADVVVSGGAMTLKTLATDSCPNKKWATGSVWSKSRMGYGFYEARIKVADITGLNNAFWMVTQKYEIDIAEVHYPNQLGITLHSWSGGKDHSVGFKRILRDNLAADFHDYGVLWTSNELIMEIDGEPVAAIVTNGAVDGSAQVRFSTALATFAGPVPANPVGHDMVVKSFKFVAL